MSNDICKLTGQKGKFVKSHIIPKALTRPNAPGNPFIQSGQSFRPKIAWDSWYDMALVTQEGEDILASYDNWAIRELKRLQLIWSSNDISLARNSVNVLSGLPSFGLRKVVCSNPKKLRMFFLSLLWRAAATNREEFREIQLKDDELNQLQEMVRKNNPEPLNFFPTTLIQIASIGDVHNFSPIAIDEMLDIGNEVPYRHYVFRFYFNGLIANMHRAIPSIDGLEAHIVGCMLELIVQTQLYNDSFQYNNLRKKVVEDIFAWPEIMKKFVK